MQIKERYEIALDKFVEAEVKNSEVLGIFVTGSYVLDKLKENSDLDVFIVTSKKTEQILAKYYDDIEFECCYKPLEQYKYNLENANDFDIQRFSSVIILYDTNQELKKIIKQAKVIYQQGPNRIISDSDLYHLNDLFLDLFN